MLFSKSIKIPNGLYDNIGTVLARTEYESPEDFIKGVLEKEVNKMLEEIQTEKELKGLGYIE